MNSNYLLSGRSKDLSLAFGASIDWPVVSVVLKGKAIISFFWWIVARGFIYCAVAVTISTDKLPPLEQSTGITTMSNFVSTLASVPIPV